MIPEKYTVLKIALTGSTAGYIGLWQQVNETVEFANLQVPIFIIFGLAVLFSLIGGLFSIFTDSMTEISKIKKLFVNFIMGLFISFVVLPMFIEEPKANLILLTAFIASFSGMVLVNILASAVHDKELQSELGGVVKSLVRGKLPSGSGKE